MAVQLVIKAPNQKVMDQTVTCDLDWTVRRLKSHLTDVYPNNPSVEEQKLIYAGRMLLDHLTLKDILRNETESKHTVHLVCASSWRTPSSPSHNNVENDSSPASSSSQPPEGSITNSLHYRGPRQPNQDSSSLHSSPQMQMPTTPGGAQINQEAVAQQMAAMQQIYAHYMTQFMQQAQVAGMPTYSDFFGTSFAGSPPAGVIGMAPGMVGGPPPAPAPLPQGQGAGGANVVPRNNIANPNVRMNAQGGAMLDEDEDDAENRDWLDWFYIICRAFILVSVVYFYSSLGRFMVVTSIAMFIYMYQAGWFGARPRVAVAPVVNREVPPPAREEQEEQRTENVEEFLTSPAEQEDVDARVQEELEDMQALMDLQEPSGASQIVIQAVPSPLKTLWLGFTSFFSSIIPEPPPPVNIN